MIDVRLMELASRQHGCFSLAQALELGVSEDALRHRLARSRLVAVHQGVLAFPPLGDSPWRRWMAATLTAPGTVLSHASAGAAWGFRPWRGSFETVTRPGDGGPVRYDGLLVMRSGVLEGDTTVLAGVPITTAERTVLDFGSSLSERELARTVREAVRLGRTSVRQLHSVAVRHPGRRGVARLKAALGRYAGIPLARCRSDAEALGLIVLHEAGRPMPAVNRRLAGEEADFSWRDQRLIVEIDGGQFHLDAGEDLRKQGIWERAGWTVRRLPAADVYERPHRLLALAPPAERR